VADWAGSGGVKMMATLGSTAEDWEQQQQKATRLGKRRRELSFLLQFFFSFSSALILLLLGLQPVDSFCSLDLVWTRFHSFLSSFLSWSFLFLLPFFSSDFFSLGARQRGDPARENRRRWLAGVVVMISGVESSTGWVRRGGGSSAVVAV
jgi:hypothetical protein